MTETHTGKTIKTHLPLKFTVTIWILLIQYHVGAHKFGHQVNEALIKPVCIL